MTIYVPRIPEVEGSKWSVAMISRRWREYHMDNPLLQSKYPSEINQMIRDCIGDQEFLSFRELMQLEEEYLGWKWDWGNYLYPHWEYWTQMDYVPVDVAIYLSNNINPDPFTGKYNAGSPFFIGHIGNGGEWLSYEEKNFYKKHLDELMATRLSIVYSNLSEIPETRLDQEGAWVRLKHFVQWAITKAIPWELPQPMLSLVTQFQTNKSLKIKELETKNKQKLPSENKPVDSSGEELKRALEDALAVIHAAIVGFGNSRKTYNQTWLRINLQETGLLDNYCSSNSKIDMLFSLSRKSIDEVVVQLKGSEKEMNYLLRNAYLVIHIMRKHFPVEGVQLTKKMIINLKEVGLLKRIDVDSVFQKARYTFDELIGKDPSKLFFI